MRTYRGLARAYSVTMRQDKRTGEYLAFVPTAYRNRHGDAYYMALTMADGWVELSPKYATRYTVTVTDYPAELKRAFDASIGYTMNLAARLYNSAVAS
jgi:hypothetical protein